MMESNDSPESRKFDHLDNTGQFSVKAIQDTLDNDRLRHPTSTPVDPALSSSPGHLSQEPPLIPLGEMPMYAPGTPVLDGINPVGHTENGEPIYAHIGGLTGARLRGQGIHFAEPRPQVRSRRVR